MTRLFDEETGKIHPVTLLEVVTQTVTQVKTSEKEGYSAVQISAHPLKKATKNKAFKHVKEFRFENGQESDLSQGDTYDLSSVTDAEKVDISATTKGKGFAGRIKRFNQSRGPMSHGSKNHRQMGSTGMCKPNRTIKGWAMPGHMGDVRCTKKDLPIMKVDTDANIIAIKGTIPGANGGIVEIKVK